MSVVRLSSGATGSLIGYPLALLSAGVQHVVERVPFGRGHRQFPMMLHRDPVVGVLTPVRAQWRLPLRGILVTLGPVGGGRNREQLRPLQVVGELRPL